MSTATANSHAAYRVPLSAAALRRFVWKEYRMFRGLWLAVLGMGALFQWGLSELMWPSADDAAVLFSTGLAAAALYAVGAAATTFSVEHEEETYAFLSGLPAKWWPLFAGKVLVATVSAMALATALLFIGGTLCNQRPSVDDASIPLGMLGIAIFEGIAWGTLFSLIVKRPLAAAVLALVVGTVVVNLAVNATSSYAVGSTDPRAYADAILARLAIVVIVLTCCVAVARRWLATGIEPARWPALSSAARFRNWAKLQFKLGSVAKAANRGTRRGMLSHLLWQSWRESWKLLLLPLFVAAVLWLGVVAAFGLARLNTEIHRIAMASTILFAPALYGAMTFSADQRRASYRFLAEHAAAPRIVWLSRHIVWLGALVAIMLALTLIAAAWTGIAMRHKSLQLIDNHVRWGEQVNFGAHTPFEIASGSSYALRGAGLAWCGMLAAYAAGQLCSMLVRSEILAAFTAIVLSVLLSAWVAVLFACQLSGLWFLLPLAAGLLLATWLRAPDWIAGRNTWRAWTGAALAVIAPFALIALLLPGARLNQLPGTITLDNPHEREPVSVDAAIAEKLSAYQVGDTLPARENAEAYIEAAERLAARPDSDALAPWLKPEFMEDGSVGSFGGIDEAKIPPDELDDYLAAIEKELDHIRQSQAAAVKAAVDTSNRLPECRFHFDLGLIARRPANASGRWQWGLESYPLYQKLRELQNAIVAEKVPAGRRLAHFLAALRMSADLRRGQPSVVFVDQLQVEQDILQRIGRWATRPGRTKEELNAAISQLSGHFRSGPHLPGALIADYLLVRESLAGKELPLVLALWPDSPSTFLSYLANRLPWERERAIHALGRVTLLNIWDYYQFFIQLEMTNTLGSGSASFRNWMRPIYSNTQPDRWQVLEPAAATSYLMRLEYHARSPIQELYRALVDNEVCRRGVLVQLALAKYRLDHDEYPARLTDLAPKYLHSLPLDPYSRQPFQYEPKGLDLRLRPARPTNIEWLEPYTPFLWSVGTGNVQLQRQRYEQFDDDENVPSDERSTVTVNAYVLLSHDPEWWNDPTFVFPLAQ